MFGVAGMKTVLDDLGAKNPKIRELKPEDLLETRFLRNLKESGGNQIASINRLGQNLFPPLLSDLLRQLRRYDHRGGEVFDPLIGSTSVDDGA